MKKIASVFSALLCTMTILTSGCGLLSSYVSGIDLPDSVIIGVNATRQLPVLVTYGGNWTYKPEYSSSNTSVVTVNSSGEIQGISEGSAVITAKVDDGNHYYDCAVDVAVVSGVSSINGFYYTASASGVMITEYTGDAAAVKIPSQINSMPVTAIAQGSFAGKSLTCIAIPDSVTSIGISAFWNCTALSAVTIPAGVATIEKSVFRKCSVLSTATLPEGTTAIGNGAFDECVNLSQITLPSSLISIGDHAFSGSALTTLSLPAKIESIGVFAFSGTAITDAALPSGLTEVPTGIFSSCQMLNSVILPESVTVIGYSAFAYSTLSSINLPAGLTEIKRGAFSETRITALTIPLNMTSVSDYTFHNCSLLSEVTIPQSVAAIGDGAFLNCSNLTKMTVQSAQPPAFTKGAICGCDTAKLVIFVPLSSLDAYRSAAGWSEYAQNISGY